MITTRTLACGLLICCGLLPQLAQAEHVYYRSGNTVYKYHGLNANGAAVLTSAIQGAPAILTAVGGLVGHKDLDTPASKDISTSSLKSCAEYAEQQRRANDLLERTAHLVGVVGAAAPAPTPPTGPRPPKPEGDKVLPSEGFGPNPWTVPQ